MSGIETDHVSILLDIKSELGSLSSRMMEAGRSRDRMEKSIDDLNNKVSEIAPVVAVVAVMKPEHDKLMSFMGRIGGYIWVGGALATGVFYLLWQGLVFFSDNIKSGLGKLFH